MNRPVRALIAALASAVLLAACGGDDGGDRGAGGDADRTVNVVMRDIAFSPAAVTVPRGAKVTFLFTNEGKVAHDAFIGDTEAQANHEREMRDTDEGGHGGHGEGEDAITVEPGKTGELTHVFDDPGDIEIGCHQPGHYGAGMKVAVTVTP